MQLLLDQPNILRVNLDNDSKTIVQKNVRHKYSRSGGKTTKKMGSDTRNTAAASVGERREHVEEVGEKRVESRELVSHFRTSAGHEK